MDQLIFDESMTIRLIRAVLDSSILLFSTHLMAFTKIFQSQRIPTSVITNREELAFSASRDGRSAFLNTESLAQPTRLSLQCLNSRATSQHYDLGPAIDSSLRELRSHPSACATDDFSFEPNKANANFTTGTITPPRT